MSYWYHHNTKNISFLALYKLFKEHGLTVPHMLHLHNNDLQDVDPYDPNLTSVQKQKIILECTTNPWYYFREVARIETMGGGATPTEHFPINKGTFAILYTAFNNLNHVVRLPRQHHRELTYGQLLAYLFLFGENGSNVGVINPDTENNAAVFNRIGEILHNLPDYFNTTHKMVERARQIKNTRLNTGVMTIPIPTSIQKADWYGRELFMNVQYYHLADSVKFFEPLFSASIPAFYRANAMSARYNSNKIRSIMISSFITDDNSSLHVDHVINGALQWEDSYYMMDLDTLREILNKESVNNFVYIEYNFFELGKDQQWYDDQCRMLNHDQDKINKELLLKRSDSNV
jgi:hypothetical protein